MTAPPEQLLALNEAIQEDLRMLRRSFRGVPAQHVRAAALQRTKLELDEKIARMRHVVPEDAALQREIEALGNDERQLKASIAQLEAERRSFEFCAVASAAHGCAVNRDIQRWVEILTGTADGASDSGVAGLEESIRAAEAQIAGIENDDDPRERLAELKARVIALSERHAAIEGQCAHLREQTQSLFEQRRAAVLARLATARRQTMLTDAVETAERAREFFGENFPQMSAAQIEKARARVTQRMAAARRALGEQIAGARTALEEHEPVLTGVKDTEGEQAALTEEIKALEQQLGTLHHVAPAVLDALGKFAVDQLQAYHSQVVRPRLEDARRESARALPQDVWNQAAS